jgi:hypothetical protein
MVPVCFWCFLVGISGGGGEIHFCGHGIAEKGCYTAWFFTVSSVALYCGTVK